MHFCFMIIYNKSVLRFKIFTAQRQFQLLFHKNNSHQTEENAFAPKLQSSLVTKHKKP